MTDNVVHVNFTQKKRKEENKKTDSDKVTAERQRIADKYRKEKPEDENGVVFKKTEPSEDLSARIDRIKTSISRINQIMSELRDVNKPYKPSSTERNMGDKS